jgi:uncharacterized membrane protein YuzA (DUF378 family)
MLKEMDMYSQIAFVLVVVGGILWGLFGLFNVNLLTSLFGGLGRLLYLIIGVGAGWLCYKIYLEKFKKSL